MVAKMPKDSPETESFDATSTDRSFSLNKTGVELDLGELLANVGVLSALQNRQSTSLEDDQSLLQDFPGIKIDLNDEMVIQFR